MSFEESLAGRFGANYSLLLPRDVSAIRAEWTRLASVTADAVPVAQEAAVMDGAVRAWTDGVMRGLERDLGALNKHRIPGLEPRITVEAGVLRPWAAEWMRDVEKRFTNLDIVYTVSE